MRSALLGALILVLAACARPTSTAHQTLPTPTPSPSPTPTAPLVPSAAGPFHAGEVGAVYTPVAVAATGGVQPYTWSISSGALPDGLSISAGTVSGTPTRAGSFAFTVQVTDSSGTSSGLPGTIGIADSPLARLNPNCVRQCMVEVGCVNVCGDFGSLSGGTPPFTFLLTGSVPPDTSIQGFSVQGTFTTPATYQFTITATDSYRQSSSISPTFNVFPHIAVAATGLCQGSYLSPCRAQVAYSGGTPGGAPRYSISGYAAYCSPTFCYPTPSGPPPSFVVSVGGGNVVASVRAACGYTPGTGGGCPAGWYGIVYLNLTDQSLCAASTYCVSGTLALTIQIAGG